MFAQFKKAMQENFTSLLAQSQRLLFVTNIDKEKLWDTYLNSFPEDLRQEYNCNCCKSFIRHYGMIVAIVNNQVQTIWNFPCEAPFDKVVKALDELVLGSPIANVFYTIHQGLGTDSNVQQLPDRTTTRWQHLFFTLPNEMVSRSTLSVDSLMGAARDNRNVFKRCLEEITVGALETTLELIAQNSLYRGAEFAGVLGEFLRLKKEYDKLPTAEQNSYTWINASKHAGSVAKIRNTSIGTLLTDISKGEDLDKAVTAFERIMAPTNYKRPNAIITQKMVEEAEKTIEGLGYANSLGRRFATVDDITVNDLLFVNRDKKKTNGTLADLKDTVPVNPRVYGKVDEITIEGFARLLPNCTKVEVLFENKHINNLVSLVTAKDPAAPTMFKWNNPFSWVYKNALSDSIREKVKSAGGSVEGELRASLEWHNYDDLDLHVTEPPPGAFHIYYGSKNSITTGGNLDVDMNAGGMRSKAPVENIIWPSQAKMREGKYVISVNQFTKRETVDIGFTVEIECQGQVLTFNYDKPMGTGQFVEVAVINYTKAKGMEVIRSLDHNTKVHSKNVWGMDTNKFYKASMILQSPNFWGSNRIGNSHLIFVLDQAHNDETARGFFNEFLKEELVAHKRVFEALGSRMKVDPTDKQVSGLGFSSTQRDELVVTVEGSFNRTLKVKF